MEKKELKNVKVVMCQGVSKKGFPYTMLKVETGIEELDYTIKPIFINSLQEKIILENE